MLKCVQNNKVNYNTFGEYDDMLEESQNNTLITQ